MLKQRVATGRSKTLASSRKGMSSSPRCALIGQRARAITSFGYFPSALLVMLLVSVLVLSGGCAQPLTPIPKGNDPLEEGEGQAKSPANLPNVQDFFPLTVGSRWDYLGEGNEFASFVREVIYAEDGRAQIREDNGGTVIAAVYETSDEAIRRVYFKAEAYENPNYLQAGSNDDMVVLMSPVRVGTQWTDEHASREIVSVNASVETPAGVFDNCVEVRSTYKNTTVTEYFKKNVGMVNQVFESEGFTVKSSLQQYDVK